MKTKFTYIPAVFILACNCLFSQTVGVQNMITLGVFAHFHGNLGYISDSNIAEENLLPETLFFNDTINVAISGPNQICSGGTTTLSPTIGGTWASSNPAVATVTNSGTVTGLSAGEATFRFTSSLGCQSSGLIVTVLGLPTVEITGPNEICIGTTTTLSPTSGGGWSSLNPTIASVINNGVVTGLSAGSAKFVFTDNYGCTSITENEVIVNLSTIPIIPKDNICIGEKIQLLPSSGTWEVSDTSIVKYLGNGLIEGVSDGEVIFTYTSNITGCTFMTSERFIVNNKPITNLEDTIVCINGFVTIAPFGGGTWTSTDQSVAIISNNGSITAINTGQVNFIYTRLANGCMSDTSETLTVVSSPSIVVEGDDKICIGASTQLSPTSGGIWYSNNSSVATITNSGLATGVALGTTTFVYKDNASNCSSTSGQITVSNDFIFESYDTIRVGDLFDLSFALSGNWTSTDPTIVNIVNNIKAQALKIGDVELNYIDTSNTPCSNRKQYLHILPSAKKIIGYTFRDVNNNETYEFNIDSPLPNIPITITSLGQTIYSDQTGYFEIKTENSQTLQIEAPYGLWDSIAVSRYADLSTSEVAAVLVGFFPSSLSLEGVVNLSSALLRCDTNVDLNASVLNTGNQNLSGKLVVDFGTKSYLASATPPPSSEMGSLAVWDFQDIKPGFSFAPEIKTFVGNPLLVGNELTFKSYLLNTSNDTLSSKSYTDEIKCSFDPNDKRAWPDREGHENYTLRTENIDYMVRFQNTGNAEAFRVEIQDILPEGLDKMTMMIAESSHDMQTMIIKDTIKFIFEDINLPDSLSDFEGSQGYVIFLFKSVNGLAEKTQIKNQAAIFFDKNAPVITNTTLNTIVTSFFCHEEVIQAIICPGDIYTYNQVDYNLPGIYSNLIHGVDGCDTLKTLYLNYFDVPSDTIWITDAQLNVTSYNGMYEWYQCENDSLVGVTDNPYFKPLPNGFYYALLHKYGCEIKTTCIQYIKTSTTDFRINEITIYPNPTTNKITIKSNHTVENVEIYTAYGEKINSLRMEELSIDFSHMLKGVYYLKVVTSEGYKILKIFVAN